MAPLIIGTDDSERQSLYRDQQSTIKIGLATQVRNDGPIKVVIQPVVQNTPGLQPALVADYIVTDTFQYAIGKPDQEATGGTFGLTVAGSTTGMTALAFDVTAAALQTLFNAAMAAHVAPYPQATITQVDTGVFRIVANTVGAIPTGTVTANAAALIPTCDIEISEVSLGGASALYRLQIQIRQAPVAYCEPATALPSTGVTATNTQALSATANAIYTITFDNVDPVSGTFILAATAFGLTKSFVVAWNSTAVDLQALLEDETNGHPYLIGNVNVSKVTSSFIIEFKGSLGPRRILSSTIANPTVITTEGDHGFPNGLSVTHSSTNSTPNTDGAQTISSAADDTYTVPVNVTVAGTAGIVRPTTSASIAVTDNDLLAPQGVSGLLYLNNENLYEYSLAQDDSFFMSASVTRTRADGTRETILGPMPIQLFKDLVSRSTLVPLPLPSYYTAVQSDARFGGLAANNSWAGTNAFGATTTFNGAVFIENGLTCETGNINCDNDINAVGHIHSSSGSIGYASGAGGTVTQLTNKSTTVILNRTCGAITMNNAALNDATNVSFTVTNSTVAATDVVTVNHSSGGTAGAYQASVNSLGAGSFKITVRNVSGGNLSEAIVLTFSVGKAVTS